MNVGRKLNGNPLRAGGASVCHCQTPETKHETKLMNPNGEGEKIDRKIEKIRIYLR